MSLNQRGGFLLIGFFLIVLILVGGGGYYFGTQSKVAVNKENEESIKVVEQAQVSNIPPLASPSPLKKIPQTNIPQDWTIQKSPVCNVSIPIPPQKEPYTTSKYPDGGAASDNNRYWRVVEDTGSAMFFFKDSTLVFFSPVNETLGNDYNPGSVSIFCAPNPNNLTSDQIIKMIEDDIRNNDYSFTVVKRGQANKWGIDAKVININGGMLDGIDSYVFPLGNKVYFIESNSGSSNQFVKDTTKQIFDNLEFFK